MHRPARLTLLLALLFLLDGTLGLKTWLPAAGTVSESAEDSYDYTLLFARVVQLIRQDYVDGTKVSYKALTYAALRGMLSSLDPHSQFLDEEDFQDIQRETRGEFSGLGIVVGVKDGALVILSPMQDSPGGRAGLLPGDRILRIGSKNTDKMTLSDAMKALRGLPGESVRLTIERIASGSPNGGSIFEVQLTRETIRVTSVRDARILPGVLTGSDKIGYVRIEEFSDNTSDELDHALDKLEHDGMQALIIDLRNNPGGLLDSAVDVAGKFLPPNIVVVSTKGRTADQTQEFRARLQRERPGYPIALLINGYSASGAEIVAGALKDLKRAILVGETTFGKGSVQTVQSLGNGVGLRLTTAKYYTPSKRTIHEVGIKPDIEVSMNDAEERRLVIAEEDESQAPNLQSDLEDRQLDHAISSLRSVRIYTQRQAELNGAPKQTAAENHTAPAPAPQ